MIIKATLYFDTHNQSYNINRIKPDSEVESINITALNILTITYKDGTKKGFMNVPCELIMDDKL